MNIYICPVSNTNLLQSLTNKIIVNNVEGNFWALNYKHRNQWNGIKKDDIFIFGSINNNIIIALATGNKYNNTDKEFWSYIPSKNKNISIYWKYVFQIEIIYEIDLTFKDLYTFLNRTHFQTQTLLKNSDYYRTIEWLEKNII